MPSVDHCVNKPSEMATITNSLEVFDTYKHREDKDSDEESFHLPLLEADDEMDSKSHDSSKSGTCVESEDDILNKFDSTTTGGECIDPKLEEHLLNEEEDFKAQKLGHKKDGSSKVNADSKLTNGEIHVADGNENKQESAEKNEDTEKMDVDKINENESIGMNKKGSLNDKDKERKETESIEKNDGNESVLQDKTDDTIDDKDLNLENSQNIEANKDEEKDKTKTSNKQTEDEIEENKGKSEDKPNKETHMEVDANIHQDNENPSEDIATENQEEKEETSKNDDASSDSVKNHNEDSEDLFDISVIKDANEDNAESAYNEAHPEGSEDGEDPSSEKAEGDKSEDDTNSDEKVEPAEEEETLLDDEKQVSEQLKNDDVDIEELTLKEFDGDKEHSEVDSESKREETRDESKDTSETDQNVKKTVNPGELRLDEVTGDFIDSAGVKQIIEPIEDKESDANNKESDNKRQSLKRGLSEDREDGAAKKHKTDGITETTLNDVEKERPPIKSLINLAEYMRSKKLSRRLTTQDLEEFCLQKICEAIAHKSELGSLRHQLKLQDQLIETMRKEIQQVTKQARDLEIVNKKLMNDLKQQHTTQKPLTPLKITRSVGLQVKFTPNSDPILKRRLTVTSPQKINNNAQLTANRIQRNIPTTITPPQTRSVLSGPQKPQQVLPKPNSPLLSQALQSRRVSGPNQNNMQQMRPKPSEPKAAAGSASVIDLTDEDEKRDKAKTLSKPGSAKSHAIPLRTTAVRVGNSGGIRLTTPQGKNSPMTSMVTTSTPQVMYVVQSPGQNVLSSGLGQKAVVVNFQSANGVITSVNGSMIQNKGNTIQLKTVPSSKTVANKVVVNKPANKHPAPLPPPPVVRVTADKPLKPIPPKPHLTIRKTDTGIILQWKMPYELDMYEVIASYQLYAYQETSAMPSTDMWRKVGDVKALALPMACTLTQFADKNKYYFAVRPVDIHKRIGVFSDPEEISL